MEKMLAGTFDLDRGPARKPFTADVTSSLNIYFLSFIYLFIYLFIHLFIIFDWCLKSKCLLFSITAKM